MDYFIRAPDFFRKEPLLMKLTFPVTKERIRNHFAYAWWQYVLLISLAIFGWNLLYTTTRYRSPNDQRLEWFYGGYQLDGEKNIDTLMDELHQSLFPDVEEVAFRALTLDETYGSMQLTVWVSAGEGDLYMLDSEYFNSIAQSEGFLELAPYIEDGTLNVDGMDLSAGCIINQETGKKVLYGIPATELPGLKDYGLICDDFCLGVCVTGENEEEALTLLQWMLTNLRGDTAAE